MAVRRHIHKRKIEEVIQQLDTFGEAITQEQADVLAKSANIVLEKSREFAPIDTGALRASGRVTLDKKKHGFLERASAFVKFGGLTSVVDRNSPDGVVRYAWVVHNRIPFLWQGYKAAQAEIMRNLQETYSASRLRKIIRKGIVRKDVIIPASRYPNT